MTTANTCYRCNADLTDSESVRRGTGRDCAAHVPDPLTLIPAALAARLRSLSARIDAEESAL